MSRYFPRIVERRTLLVRVSSSSSASSSLSNSAKAWIRGGQVLAPARHFPPDQWLDLRFAREVLEGGERHAVGLRPAADRAHVHLDQRHDERSALAHRHRLPHVRAELELVLDERGGES